MANADMNRAKFEELAADMEKRPEFYGRAQHPDLYKEVIENLRNLEYDDFGNEKYAAPKLTMIAHFEALGVPEVVEAVKNGDYDQ